MAHLVVVVAPSAARAGKFQLSDKTVSGMRAIRARWQGTVTYVVPPIGAASDANLGLRWWSADDIGLRVVSGDPVQSLRELQPDVVQASLVPRDRAVVTLGFPTVLVAENTARDRLGYAWPNISSRQRPRASLGAMRQELVHRRMVASSHAVVCNGWSAWNAYRKMSERIHRVRPVLTFDTRLSEAKVALAATRLNRTLSVEGPLRLAFSGRLHPAKGPQFAVGASALLERMGVAHTLTLFGDGPMRNELESMAGSVVTFTGQVDFEPNWVQRVSTEVDLMVLPHTQGDPSGTYLESAGLGVPVVGFTNSAMRGHERQGFAWTTTKPDERALAALIAELDVDRKRIREAAQRGVDFMSDHSFERSFDARVEQLAIVASLSSGGARMAQQ